MFLDTEDLSASALVLVSTYLSRLCVCVRVRVMCINRYNGCTCCVMVSTTSTVDLFGRSTTDYRYSCGRSGVESDLPQLDWIASKRHLPLGLHAGHGVPTP